MIIGMKIKLPSIKHPISGLIFITSYRGRTDWVVKSQNRLLNVKPVYPTTSTSWNKPFTLENRSSQKESTLPTTIFFRCSCVSSTGFVYRWFPFCFVCFFLPVSSHLENLKGDLSSSLHQVLLQPGMQVIHCQKASIRRSIGGRVIPWCTKTLGVSQFWDPLA